MKSRRLRWWLVGGAVVLLAVTSPCWGLMLIFRWVPDLHARWVREPFDSVAWKAANPQRSERRLLMLPSLLRDVRFVGKPIDEVRELLGDVRCVETQEVDPGTIKHVFQVGYAYRDGGPLMGDWNDPFLEFVVSTADDRVLKVNQLAGLGVMPWRTRRQE